MNESRKRRIEFGDWQTPDSLAMAVCEKLTTLGINPDIVIEPTCGSGAFVLAAAKAFKQSEILGFEANADYLAMLRPKVDGLAVPDRIHLKEADFFATDWTALIRQQMGRLLVIGNFPWVTNAVLGAIGGSNLPGKSNFQHFNGLDAITGKANFDISEWMLIEVLRWFDRRDGDLAMLVKTSVARKILSYAEQNGVCTQEACLIEIDAKAHFGASVDACLLVMRFSSDRTFENHDYKVFTDFSDKRGQRVGHRYGLTIGNLDAFESTKHLLGKSPQKWRSGVKHDASSVMELTRVDGRYLNGLGEAVELEPTYLYPLLKGSDVGNPKRVWRDKFLLVPQRFVGESTDQIRTSAPKTWAYLESHASILDARGSIIYKNNPKYSIFGIGDYAFLPWRIAICGLYKSLGFRLIGPVDGKPVMFDDTVYFVSFDTESEAQSVLDRLQSPMAISFLTSLIFWDEKRPVKTSILNALDWRLLDASEPVQLRLPFMA